MSSSWWWTDFYYTTKASPCWWHVICVTMVFTVLCAKAVGCLLPLLAERIHLDPAVMASPFISTVVDVVTLVLYFQVARAILHI